MTQILDTGLYEVLITAGLESRLQELEDRLTVDRTDLHHAEAASRIALHLSRVIERAIASLKDEERVQLGVELAHTLRARLDQLIDNAEAKLDAPVQPASVLQSILGRRPDGSVTSVEVPLIPLLDTTLLTNAPGEPRVGRQLQAEIDSLRTGGGDPDEDMITTGQKEFTRFAGILDSHLEGRDWIVGDGLTLADF